MTPYTKSVKTNSHNKKFESIRSDLPVEEIARACMESKQYDVLRLLILRFEGKYDEARNFFYAQGGRDYFGCDLKNIYCWQYKLKKNGDTYLLVNREGTHLWIMDANQLVTVVKETIALLKAQFGCEKVELSDVKKKMTRNGWKYRPKAVELCFFDHPDDKGNKDCKVFKGSSDNDSTVDYHGIKSCTVGPVEQALLNDNSTADLHVSKSGNSVDCIPKGIDKASLVAGHGVDQAMVDDFHGTNYVEIVNEEFDAKLDEKYATEKYEFTDRAFKSVRADFKNCNACAEANLKQQKETSDLIEYQMKECNTQMKEYSARLRNLDGLLKQSVASSETTTKHLAESRKLTGSAYSEKTSAFFELLESRKRAEKAKYRREQAKKLQDESEKFNKPKAAIADTENGKSNSTWLSLPSRLFGGTWTTKDRDIVDQEEHVPAATRDDVPMVARASEDVDEKEQVPMSGRDCAPTLALATEAAPATPRARANNDRPVRRSARKSARADRYGH